jgi:hypothetical protein
MKEVVHINQINEFSDSGLLNVEIRVGIKASIYAGCNIKFANGADFRKIHEKIEIITIPMMIFSMTFNLEIFPCENIKYEIATQLKKSVIARELFRKSLVVNM